jgi:acetone carboxylase gamma subunit
MIVCAKCLKEMRCVKNGSDICFNGGTYVYPADQYECPECGALVNVSTAAEGFHIPNPVASSYDIRMS